MDHSKVQKDYHDNGKLKSEAEIKNGVQHGESRFYYEDGNLFKIAFFENGQQVDTMKIFYRNGQLQEVSIIVDGLKNGFFADYYDNGKLKTTGQAKFNLPDGEWKFFDDTESLLKLMYYDSGDLISNISITESLNIYENYRNGYSLTLNSTWHKKEENPSVVLFHSVEDTISFSTTLNILVNKVQSVPSLEMVVESNLEEIKRGFKDVQFYEAEPYSAKVDGMLVSYTANHDSRDVGVYQFYTVHNSAVHILTLVTHPNEMALIKDQFMRLVKSFSYLPQSGQISL